MDTLETKFTSIHQINFVMETLLVVGNLGASIANHRLGTEQMPPPKTITSIYMAGVRTGERKLKFDTSARYKQIASYALTVNTFQK